MLPQISNVLFLDAAGEVVAGANIHKLSGFGSFSDVRFAGGGRRTLENRSGIVSTCQIRGYPYFVAVMFTKKNVLRPWYHETFRDDEGYWERVEAYVQRHSQADFSHGICPDCARKHYPELDLFNDQSPASS